MGIEIAIPVILCVVTGFLFFIGYLLYKKRIRYLTGILLTIPVVAISSFLCWRMYNVFLLEQQAVKQQQPLHTYFGQSAEGIVSIGKQYPDVLMKEIKGKVILVHGLYLVAETEKNGRTLYVLSDKPGGAMEKTGNMFFFGMAVDEKTKKQMGTVSKITPLTAVLEFVEVQHLGKQGEVPVYAFMVLIRKVDVE